MRPYSCHDPSRAVILDPPKEQLKNMITFIFLPTPARKSWMLIDLLGLKMVILRNVVFSNVEECVYNYFRYCRKKSVACN